MMKAVTLIAVLISFSGVIADKKDFPAFDPSHAHCALETYFPNANCSVIYNRFVTTVNSYKPEPQSKGYYRTIESKDSDYVWVTRETPKAHYIDDILFVFLNSGNSTNPSCDVQSRSRSQTLSYFDYDTNYCNMWTVFQGVGGYQIIRTNKCEWIPDNAKKICAIY